MKKLFTISIICGLILNVQIWVFAQEEPGQLSIEDPQGSSLESSGIVQQEPQVAGQDREERLEQLRQKWQNLSAEERDRLRAKFRAFRQLPPEKRQQIKNNLRRFNSLPLDKRALIIKRSRKWQQLTPEEKALYRDRLHERNQQLIQDSQRSSDRKVKLPPADDKDKEGFLKRGLPQGLKKKSKDGNLEKDKIFRGRENTRTREIFRKERMGGGDLPRRSPIENRRRR